MKHNVHAWCDRWRSQGDVAPAQRCPTRNITATNFPFTKCRLAQRCEKPFKNRKIRHAYDISLGTLCGWVDLASTLWWWVKICIIINQRLFKCLLTDCWQSATHKWLIVSQIVLRYGSCRVWEPPEDAVSLVLSVVIVKAKKTGTQRQTNTRYLALWIRCVQSSRGIRLLLGAFPKHKPRWAQTTWQTWRSKRRRYGERLVCLVCAKTPNAAARCRSLDRITLPPSKLFIICLPP